MQSLVRFSFLEWKSNRTKQPFLFMICDYCISQQNLKWLNLLLLAVSLILVDLCHVWRMWTRHLHLKVGVGISNSCFCGGCSPTTRTSWTVLREINSKADDWIGIWSFIARYKNEASWIRSHPRSASDRRYDWQLHRPRLILIQPEQS